MSDRAVARHETLPMLAAAATGIQVGAALVATRFVIGDVAGPGSLAMLRYVTGFLCLVPFVVLVGRRGRIRRRDALPLKADPHNRALRGSAAKGRRLLGVARGAPARESPRLLLSRSGLDRVRRARAFRKKMGLGTSTG